MIWLSFIVCPEESERPNKVNEYDHSVPLDLPRQQLVVPALLALKQQRLGADKLWLFQYTTLSQEFSRAISTLGLDGVGLSLYGLRH